MARPMSGISRASATPSLEQVLEEAGSQGSAELSILLPDLGVDLDLHSHQYADMLDLHETTQHRLRKGRLGSAPPSRSPVLQSTARLDNEKSATRAQSAGGLRPQTAK